MTSVTDIFVLSIILAIRFFNMKAPNKFISAKKATSANTDKLAVLQWTLCFQKLLSNVISGCNTGATATVRNLLVDIQQ